MDREELEDRFTHHPPITIKDQADHEEVRTWVKNLAFALDRFLPDGREKSLVITHLEEVMFWSNAALARNRAKQLRDSLASG